MKKAAIFDLDNTLIWGPSSERMFINCLLKKKEITLSAVLSTFLNFFRNLGKWDRMIFQNKYYLKGKSLKSFKQIANEYFMERVDKLVPEYMMRIIQYHRDRGDILIIISGTLSFILDIFAQKLFFDDKKGTELEVKGGKFTGKISGIYPRGYGKVVIFEEFIKKYEIDLAKSTMYANHFTDRFVMEKVGNPVAVNPDRNLLRYAKNHKWKILPRKSELDNF